MIPRFPPSLRLELQLPGHPLLLSFHLKLFLLFQPTGLFVSLFFVFPPLPRIPLPASPLREPVRMFQQAI